MDIAVKSLLLCCFGLVLITLQDGLCEEVTTNSSLNLDTNVNASEFLEVPELGRFAIDLDFYHPIYRPINVLPQEREEINTIFELFTRQSEHQILRANDRESIDSSDFLTTRETKILVHGWLDTTVNALWMTQLMEQLLEHGDYNVIIVDWKDGNHILYTQAVANARIVGAEIAFLIQYLQNVTELNPESCHIIGHSLGAHIAGYAGKRIPNLGRITGLDPAEPFFQYMPVTVRLDRSDAQFVDVIHTDSDPFVFFGLGLEQAIGHVDFYPNGGRLQPGCSRTNYLFQLPSDKKDAVRRLLNCHHQRAVDFYIASVAADHHCRPIAFQCRNWDAFRRGQCTDCGHRGEKCAVMGWRAIEFKPHLKPDRSVSMYLVTGSEYPFCVYMYEVIVQISPDAESSREVKGKLTMNLHDFDGTLVELSKSDQVFYPGGIYRYVVVLDENFSTIDSVYLSWSAATSFFKTIFGNSGSSPIRIRGIEVSPIGFNNDKEGRDNLGSTKWLCSSPESDGVAIQSGRGVVLNANQTCPPIVDSTIIFDEERST